MANRALQNKVRVANRQRAEASFDAYAKLGYWNNDNLDAQYRGMRELIASIHPDNITRCPPGKAYGLSKDYGQCGKGQRRLAKKTYGNGERPYHDAAKTRYYEQYAPLNRTWDIYAKV